MRNSPEPGWLTFARTLINTKEAAGTANNPTILKWAADLKGWVAQYFRADSTPWCGLFVAHVLSECGLPTMGDKSLSALSWIAYGQETYTPTPGAILVFNRPGGYHVAFYVDQDATNYHILGGNQSDTVSITRMAKSRCIAVRWPSAKMNIDV